MNPFRVPVIFIIISLGDAQGDNNLSRWDKNITFSILFQLPLIRRYSKRVDLSQCDNKSPLERGAALAVGCVTSLNLLFFTLFYYFFGMY